MVRRNAWLGICVLLAGCALPMSSQQTATNAATALVPPLVNFSGRALDARNNPVAGTVGLTFGIYRDQYEGSPIWIENQNVQADAKGNYTVQLGASSSAGLPLSLFSSGEARWLGVIVNGASEQPRILLLSVPYALMAADAQTLAGLPPSAFVMAPPSAGNDGTSASTSTSASSMPGSPNSGKKPSRALVSGSGTQGFVPLWTDNNGTLGNSVFFQLGSGATAKIGLNLKNPLATLDINGTTLIRGTLEPITKGTATASKAFTSNALDLEASSFNSSTQKAVMQHFEWQAEPTGNNTTAPGATLNLLFGQNNNLPAETGLSISTAGAITANSGVTGFSPAAASAGITGTNAVGGYGVLGQATGNTGQGVWGESFGTASANGNGPDGVHGVNHSSMGAGVAGLSLVGFGQQPGIGVYGQGSPGVYGAGAGFTGTGVTGSSSFGTGVYGTSSLGSGVYGSSSSAGGVYGSSSSADGVYGTSTTGKGVEGLGDPGGYFSGNFDNQTGGNTFGGDGVDGFGGDSENGFGGAGLVGTAGFGFGVNASGFGLFAEAVNGYAHAGEINGDLEVVGTLSKSSGSFKIDHPLDPANKYLYHSFVESPDMMNVYNGNVVLDGRGEAVVVLPEWFEVLNRDFRYQLTAIGAPGPNLYVAEEVSRNRFKIAGGSPQGKVSWQVTGIRHDAWANAHRIPVEEQKSAMQRGYYLHPELYGAPEEKQIEWLRFPKLMREVQARRAKFLAKSSKSQAVQK